MSRVKVGYGATSACKPPSPVKVDRESNMQLTPFVAATIAIVVSGACTSSPEISKSSQADCDTLASLKYSEFVQRLTDLQIIKVDHSASVAKRRAATDELAATAACMSAVAFQQGQR